MGDERQEPSDEVVLKTAARIEKPSRLLVVSGKPAVIVRLHVVAHDEGDDVVRQALSEHDDAPHASVAILERMDPLESKTPCRAGPNTLATACARGMRCMLYFIQ